MLHITYFAFGTIGHVEDEFVAALIIFPAIFVATVTSLIVSFIDSYKGRPSHPYSLASFIFGLLWSAYDKHKLKRVDVLQFNILLLNTFLAGIYLLPRSQIVDFGGTLSIALYLTGWAAVIITFFLALYFSLSNK